MTIQVIDVGLSKVFLLPACWYQDPT